LPTHHSEPTPRGLQILSRVKSLAAGAAILQTLSACALVTPMSQGADFEATASIAPAPADAKKAPALPASLDEEDRRRALGALAIALDPQGNGATVRWDNPVSKARGSVTPAGFAYPANDLICRDFMAQFSTASGPQTARGAACRDKNAQWTLAEFRPAK
jgi:surface antigen